MDNSPRPPKEFCHMDVATDGIAMNTLADVYNDGWELFAPPAWDNNYHVWRVLLYRDGVVPAPVAPEPTPKPRVIAEATPTVVIPPVVLDVPAPPPATDQPSAPTGDEAESVDTPLDEIQPPLVVVLAPTLFPPTNFEDELRRIRADKSLSPMEKIEALKAAGDTIAINKARVAGQLAWDAWNKLYPPVSPNFRLLPSEVKS